LSAPLSCAARAAAFSSFFCLRLFFGCGEGEGNGVSGRPERERGRRVGGEREETHHAREVVEAEGGDDVEDDERPHDAEAVTRRETASQRRQRARPRGRLERQEEGDVLAPAVVEAVRERAQEGVGVRDLAVRACERGGEGTLSACRSAERGGVGGDELARRSRRREGKEVDAHAPLAASSVPPATETYGPM